MQELEGQLRPICPACEFVVYRDPKVAAGVIVTLNGEVVLLRRGIEPSLGKWVFPGGYVAPAFRCAPSRRRRRPADAARELVGL